MVHRPTSREASPIGHHEAENSAPTSFSYYAVFIDYGRRGLEAVVDPEITRREVVSRIQSGEYKHIARIHFVTMNDTPQDVTEELIAEAKQLEAA